jgi:threonine/homoserine/homoserine lactone efflux protein
MLYVISNSISQGRKAGIVSALGIGIGTIVHTLVAALGLAIVLAASTLAFNAIRYAGAIYLAYLGIRTLLTKNGPKNLSEPRAASGLKRAFLKGIVTNVLNPKVALFFLAFLPQFADASNLLTEIILLGVIFDTSGTILNVLVALLAAYASAIFLRGRRGMILQRWLPGTILLGLSLLVTL